LILTRGFAGQADRRLPEPARRRQATKWQGPRRADRANGSLAVLRLAEEETRSGRQEECSPGSPERGSPGAAADVSEEGGERRNTDHRQRGEEVRISIIRNAITGTSKRPAGGPAASATARAP